MCKLSSLIAKLEEKLEKKFKKFIERYKGKFVMYIPIGLVAWYFYGMIINSIRLGINSTFNATGTEIGSIWVANPIRNFAAVFTPTGLATTAICFLLICLITKKGYFWFSGYKYTKDKRGFDILPDATHGSSGFMSKKEMQPILNLNSIENTTGTILGKLKDSPDDDNKYAEYLSIKQGTGLSDHSIIFGSTGSGKSRGYVTPFILQAIKRKESLIIVDAKGELYERTSEYMRSVEGYTTKIFNLLDPVNSDGWNSLHDIEFDPMLVDAIAETIIKNTSNVSERQDFWEKAEKNLLQALMHYVQSQKVPGTNQLLPIEQRSLGEIYKMLSDESFADLERRFDELPKGHPAKAPYGIFKLANRQIWGNIAIGLGNRLSVFQNEQLHKTTTHNDIDLTLPGKQPCAYYCVISAQGNPYEFLSSLFFSCMFSRLTDYARRDGIQGRLPVTVNFLLEEFCNIGKLVDFKRELAELRGFNINCQLVVQSASGLSDRYPKDEWEELISHCDTMICLGANDMKTANYISDKCGSVTIRVNNNQMPLMPLFSPIYSSTRPYSQTQSNTKRALMMPDEVLRMDNKKCIVLLRGQKPLFVDKVVPEEFPVFEKLKYTKITDYVPLWRREETAIPAPVMSAPFNEPRGEPRPNESANQMEMELGMPKTLEKYSVEIPQDDIKGISWDTNMEYSVISENENSNTSVKANESVSPTSDDRYGGFGIIDEVTIQAIKNQGKKSS